MRFLAGLRLVVVAVALIGLLAGRSVVFPVATAQTAMAVAAVDGGHDCCGKTSSAPGDKAGLTGTCLGIGCSMIALAVLPATPAALFRAERLAETPIVAASLQGRSLAPPLEPPRA